MCRIDAMSTGRWVDQRFMAFAFETEICIR